MQRLTLITSVIVYFFFLTPIFSQSSASLDNRSFLESDLTEMTDDNWSFYVDEENQLYFIDFEKLNVNLSTVIVSNEKGEVLIKDDVLDLPVNTIYEIDFSNFGTGNYQIEIRSFTGFIKKEVSIK